MSGVKRQSRRKKVRLSSEVNFVVPKENILDLKKIIREKEIERSRQQSKEQFDFKKLFTKKFKPALEQKLDKPSPAAKPLKQIIPKEKRQYFVELIDGFNIFRQKFFFPKGWKKTIGTFVVVAVVLVAPIYGAAYYQRADSIKGEVLGATTQAYQHLESASLSAGEFDFATAFSEFTLALDGFSAAQMELAQISSIVKAVPQKGGQLSSGENLLFAGERFAEAGQYISKAIGPLMELKTSPGEEKWTLVTALMLLDTNLTPAVEQISRARTYLDQVDIKDIPGEHRDKIGAIKESLPKMQTLLSELSDVSSLAINILGSGQQKRYLFLFQDNSEIRPTGGFIGSFAQVTFEEGKITQLQVPPGGTYDLNGYLKEQVIAPAPLHLVNPHWYAQDANWYPSWPHSARKFMWFYEKSDGPSVDGVIALTPDVLETLLSITGPIEMPEFGVTVNSENVREVLLAEVAKARQTNSPKQIIANLVPQVINSTLTIDLTASPEVITKLRDLLAQKQLLFYFNDPVLQQKVASRNWAGQIYNTKGDYLLKIDTNIAGGKTDHLIDEVVKHTAEIQDNGQIIDTVEVTRSHRGNPADPIESVKNMDFVRFYVPAGSELISAEGFTLINPRMFIYPNQGYKEDEELEKIQGRVIIDEASGTRINNEFGYTVFGNWIGVEAGQTATIKIVYQLPFKLERKGFFEKTGSYTLLNQKQAGSFVQHYIYTVKFPQSWQVIWKYPDTDEVRIGEGEISMERVLKQDSVLATVFKE